MHIGRIDLVQTVRRTTVHSYQDDVTGLAADLAFRFFLSLFPFFIFITTLGGYVATRFGGTNPVQRVVSRLGGALPFDVTNIIQTELNQVIQSGDIGLLSIGVVGTLWALSSGINSLFKALNRAYGVQETRALWKRYVVAVGLTVLAGTLIVGSFALFLTGQLWGQSIMRAAGAGRAWDTTAAVVRWTAVIVLVLTAVTLLYWAAPNLELKLIWTAPDRCCSPRAGQAPHTFSPCISRSTQPMTPPTVRWPVQRSC